MSEPKRLSAERLAWLLPLPTELRNHIDAIEAELAAAKEECERLRDALRELHDFAGPLEHYRYTKRSKDAFEMAAKLLQEPTPNAVIAEHPADDPQGHVRRYMFMATPKALGVEVKK